MRNLRDDAIDHRLFDSNGGRAIRKSRPSVLDPSMQATVAPLRAIGDPSWLSHRG
ncbi:MAG: hypothetical protein JNL44_13365 [Gemmatimonadetes bacterium]|nr:hypothetical protein [Gemmatimonadota bacterium]